MATKKNKSAAIRKALQNSKSGSPKEVAETLRKQGYKVSAQYVSSIKAAAKKRKHEQVRRPGRPPATKSSNSNELQQANALLQSAVDLVIKSGGAKQARELISNAETLIGKVRTRVR